MAQVKKVIAYAEVFPSGQRSTAVILKYDCKIVSVEALKQSYEVKNRKIVDAYTSEVPEKGKKESTGHYVVVELSIDDENAPTVNSGIQKSMLKQGGPPSGGPKKRMDEGTQKPQGGSNDGPGPGQGKESMVHRIPKISIAQIKPVRDENGMLVLPFEERETEEAIQPIVDDFKQFQFGDMWYNLFVPKNYDAKKKYPLVMFLHDAEPSGTDPLLTLVQGIGAISFASKRDQQKHECFVLAPELLPNLRPYEEEGENDIATAVKPILDHVMSTYNIDEKRVYTTGQSGGCMTSCELNHRYPDLFAASLLVAGQWNVERMKNTKNNHYWICVSEHDVQAFPGMTELVCTLEKEGAHVSRYECDAKSTSDELNRLANQAAKENSNIKFTVFQGDSVVEEGFPKTPITNHLSTWQIAYGIDEIRDWLFTNTK